ncbi:MAG: NFACT RNA binding domain-containing protein [Candidatus Micrarchaeota archaeon]|nr:NFACT RNA binding domain-containing protein [Candidatus Micrarchaeota archaeon]MCX8154366.1 NFACT RNA binding domain-containing protein [Candidatus Micrarchaeota archaeon]
MRIEIDTELSAYENAVRYYEMAKELRKKLQGMREALVEIDRKIQEERKRLEEEARELESQKRIVTKREWYERFNWSFTSWGRIVLIGRDENQNETLVRSYFSKSDLFFHADIKGAATVILKDGLNSTLEERLEVAQIAASYSRGWKEGVGYLNVYSARYEQVTKSSGEGSLGIGGFLIQGEREWYKNTPLSLKVGLRDGKVYIVSEYYTGSLDRSVILAPGRKFSKGEIAKRLAKYYNVHPDEFLIRLPSGDYVIRS